MFIKIFNKLKELEEHHQVLFALVAVIGIVFLSWGIEKILEEYIFPKRHIYSYLLSIFFGLFVLWLTKYIILKVM